MQGIQNRFCPHQFPGLASGFNQPTLLCTLVGFFFLLFLVSSSVPCFWTAGQVKMLGLCHTQSSRSTENVWFVVVPHTKSRMDSRTSTLQFTSPLSLLVYTLFVGSKPKNSTKRPPKSCETRRRSNQERGEKPKPGDRKPWPARVTGRSVTTPPPPGCSGGRASSAPPCSGRRGGAPPRRS